MDRRTFFKLTGLAGATAAAAGCSDHKDPLKLLYSQVVPEEIVPLGEDAWFATQCQECRAGCSVLVRVVEGRAKKIEGNPLFPVNRGKTCARGQAALQGLYNPDRWKAPKRRKADGTLETVEWEAALAEAASTLNRLREKGQRLLIVTPPLTGHLFLIFRLFVRGFGSADWVRWAPFEDTVLRSATKENLGLQRLPIYRLAEADLILSFGADFLATELSPVYYGNQYGRFRRGEIGNGRRGRWLRGVWYHFEPRLSVTGSNADRWIPVEPGFEGIVALALVGLLLDHPGLRLSGAARRRWRQRVPAVSVAEAEKHLDVRGSFLEQLAERLLQARRPVVIGGGAAAGTQTGSANLWAIYALQAVLQSAGADIPLQANPPSPLKALETFRLNGDGTELEDAESGFRRLEQAGKAILAGREPSYGAILVWGLDLSHALPGGSSLLKAFEKIPARIVASPFPNDTCEKATLILPASTPLEAWGDGVPDPGPGVSAWALSQPAAMPLYDTRSPGDLLLDLAKRLPGKLAEMLPWKDTAQALDDSLFKLHDRFASQTGVEKYDEFFNGIVARGGWYRRPDSDEFVPLANRVETVSRWLVPAPPAAIRPTFAGEQGSYPFYLLPYPSLSLLSGDGANRPWLQELGDPLTSVVWGTWAEVNPTTAGDLGLEDGDEVRLETPHGSLTVPVYIYPGVRPDTIAVPAGGGHRAYGRYARNRGANVMALLPATEETHTGALAWVSTRVRVVPTGRKGKLVKQEGSGRWLEGSEFPV